MIRSSTVRAIVNLCEFTIGTGQVIPGFEEAVIGLEPGSTARTRIPAEKAYGAKVEELRVASRSGSQFPDDIGCPAGGPSAHDDTGRPDVPVEVVELSDGSVVVDANHPLAGQALTFEIELVEVA